MTPNLVADLDSRIAARHLLLHPFYRAWSDGTLTMDQLKTYAKQYYWQVEAFPRYVSGVHSQCADTSVRRELLENLVTEEGGQTSHAELWLRFCESLGVSRDEVFAEEPLPETIACVERMLAATQRQGFDAGVAALYAYESQIPAVAKTKLEGLAAHYGIDNARAISFFTEHLSADTIHAEVERTMLAKADLGAARAGVEETLAAVNGILDGVCRAANVRMAA